MRFKERNDLANRCKEWIKDQIENNITIPFDPVRLVLAYLDVNGYLNKVVRCKDCKDYDSHDHRCKFFNHGMIENDYCSRVIERREDDGR